MPVTHKAERGERAEHVPVVLLGAVIGLDAPQREQHPAFDAEFLLHRVEGLRPFLRLALAIGDAAARGDIVDIGADRLAVFRLPLGGRDHARIGRHAFEREIEGGARDALGLRVRPQRGFEGGEGLLLRARRHAAEREDEGEDGNSAEHHALRSECSRFASHLIAATPDRRRGAPAGRRFPVPAAPCARSPARCATAAPDRRSTPASARAGR